MKRFRFSSPEREQLDAVFHRCKRETSYSCREFLIGLEGVVTRWRDKYGEYGERVEEAKLWTEMRERERRILGIVERLMQEFEDACKHVGYGAVFQECHLWDDSEPDVLRNRLGFLERFRDDFKTPKRKKPIDLAALELDVETLLSVENYGIEIKDSELGDAVRALQLCYKAAGTPLTEMAARKHVERFLKFPRGERGPGSIRVDPIPI